MTTLQLVANRPDRNREITLRIKERLGRGDLTRTNLADMTGISRPTISRRLSGGVWQLDELELVAQALHLNWNWLVTGEGNAESPRPEGPDGGTPNMDLGIKSPKLFQLSYRGTSEGTNVVPMRGAVAA